MKHFTTTRLAALLLLLSAPAFSAEIIHNPVLTAPAAQPVVVTAVLSGADSGTRTRLYYRAKGKEQFANIEMNGSPSNLSAEIPGATVEVAGVEYYIEAAAKGLPVASSPANNPKLNPHFISVRRDESKPIVTVLSPMEGDTVESSTPVITVSFEDADTGIDPSSVLVKVDGSPVKDKSNVQAFETLASYVPAKPLSEGAHEAVVVVKDKAGNAGSAKWSFTVKSRAGAGAAAAGEKKMAWDGYAGYETQYGSVLTQPSTVNSPLPYRPYGVNQGRLEVNGRGPSETYQLKAFVTDEERTDSQPLDRATLLVQNDEGLVALGNYSPAFSQLSLYYPYYFLGATADLRSGGLNEGHTRLMGVAGMTQRAVAQGVGGFSGGTTAAAFAQYLYGVRWEFGGKYFQMGFNAVTVNDDAGSLDSAKAGALTPKYTGVMSTDAKIAVPEIYLSLTGELGADYYFNGPSVLGPNAGSAYRAGLDWNAVPIGSHLFFDWKDLGGSFGFLPGGYTSMANPGLVPDYRGYESGFSQSLMDGQLGFGWNWNAWRDNLQSTVGRSTVTNNFLSAFINLGLSELPYLNLGYSLSTQKSDADGVTLPAQDNRTGSLNVGLGYTRPLGERASISGNLAYINTAFVDASPKRSGQDLASNTYVLSLFYTLGGSSFSAAGSLGTTDQPGFGASGSFAGLTAAARTGANNSVSVAWSQQWVARVFDTRLAYDLASNSSDSPAAGFFPAMSSSSTRSTVSLNAYANAAVNHRFGLGLSYAAVASSATTASVTVNDSAAMLLSSASYNWTF